MDSLIEEIKKCSTILLVDDLAENLFSLSKILQAQGYLTESTNCGEKALKMLLKKEYSLILLDVQMPGLNGYEVAEALKGAKKTKHIPLIFLTAMCKEKRLAQYTESGPVDYIVKPFEVDLLLMRINNFLRFNHMHKKLVELSVGIIVE
ncbi:MAG: response regulator [Bacteroidetes bacterium]|nr:response regulator [Bacteroidota bacterium]